MLQNLKARLGLIVLLAAACIALLVYNHARKGSIVTLGLDLQGGTHLALEIDEKDAALTPAQRSEAIDRALKVVRIRVNELGVSEPVVQKAGNDRIIVELAGLQNTNQAKDVISKAAFLEFQIVKRPEEVAQVVDRLDQVVTRTFPAAAAGTAKAPAAPAGGVFQQKGADSASASTPAGKPFTSLIARGGGTPGQFMIALKDTAKVAGWLRDARVRAGLPRGTQVLWGVAEAEAPEDRGFRSLWVLDDRAIMTGAYLESAVAGSDPQFNKPVVNFELSRRGGTVFERETGRNLQRQMAIVLDDQVYTAPTIQSQIGRNGQITLGNASLDAASELALVLRAGSLPAPLKVVEERTVGPSMGQDSVNSGFVAGLIGVVGVVLIMLSYYRLAGLFAVGALSLYVVYTLGSLAALDAVLTFPGIAALVLSIGMSVDANVLIFERIREELDAGRAVKPAVSEGFKQALSAIVDSNITTLLTAIVLYYVGTGPIKGFAVTLGIGLVISMFTAIFVTRTFFTLYLERRSPAAQGLSI